MVMKLLAWCCKIKFHGIIVKMVFVEKSSGTNNIEKNQQNAWAVHYKQDNDNVLVLFTFL